MVKKGSKIRQKRKGKEGQAVATRDKKCEKIIEYGILGLIIFSPLPAASVHEWSILVIQLMVLVMMAAYFLMKEKPQTSEPLSLIMKRSRYLFLALFIFLFVQIIPLPLFIIKIFSPNTHAFHELFSGGFSRMNFMSFSLIPSHTLREGLELLSYFLLGFLIVKTVTKRRQIMRIYSVLIAMGVFQAFYGLFELYSKNPRILFYKKIHGLDSVTGSFVNRNHLSGYLEMIIPLAIGLIIARIDLFSLTGLKLREKLLRLSEKRLSTNILISLGIIIMSLAIIFSKSRSGVFLLVFSFILFLGLTVLYFGRALYQNKQIKNFLKILFLIITFISLYIGIEATIERFSLDRLLQEGRPTYWSNTVGIFLDSPFLGTGLGTFASLYPDIEGGGGPVQLIHAHNDYLEYLSELGLVGMVFLLGGIFIIAISSFLIWRMRRHPEVKGLALGGIIAIICIMIHSITDFNLHIPANMLLFSIVLSLTAVTVTYKHQGKGKTGKTQSSKPEKTQKSKAKTGLSKQ